MCGIAGYFGRSEIEQKKIAYCRKLMKNRGPDSSNIYTNHKKKKLYLLHSRLSIIDLNSRSNQPFIDGDNILIFNGEIYNYIELKKKIEKKYKFKTKSDTEVILAYYKLYGTKCFDYFDGMWSLAIYNSTKDELVLSRDRFGEKPLYINKTKDGIFFGSEIKYIQALSGKKYDVNLKKVKNFLQFGYKSIFKDNESFFKSILNLNSGTYLLIRKKKYLNRRFWSLQNKKVLKSNINNVIKKFRESFFNTLKLRLRSDVPIAICLSGGIDSATLAGVSKIKFKNNLEAFSIIDNKDNRYNEKTNILKIVKYLKIKHNFLYVANKLDFTRLKRQIKYHDSPVFTITNYLQNFLAEEISRKKFKVVLSGSGADEIFSGYYDHQLMYLYEVRKNKKLFKDHYLSWKKNILPKIRNKYFKDPYLFFKNKNNRQYIYDHNEELKRFFFQPLKNNFVEKKYIKSLLKNRMLNETFFENVPIFTHSEDLNFMQYSIENRSPYLSRNLFDKSFETPSKFLMHKGYTKYLLRKISKNFIPNEVRLDKQKKGFNASINSLVNLKSKRFMKFINKNSPIYKIVNKKEILREIRKSNNENYFSKFIFSFISVKIFLDLNS